MKKIFLKRISCMAAAFALTLLFSIQAFAAGTAELVRVFVYENTLYTYVDLEGTDRPVTQVEAKIGNQSFPASGHLETVRQAGFPVTYLLLVDNSNSMPDYRESLADFCGSLAEKCGEKTRFILATFGDQFEIIGENIPAEELKSRLSDIPYDETVTRLHSCIGSALDYFETLARQGNELRSLVVLSDAVQYDPNGGLSYEELSERVRQSDVMLHSIGFGNDEAALERLGKLTEASGGVYQKLSEKLTPKAAADELTQTDGDLLVTGFDLSGLPAAEGEQKISITFAANGALVCRAETTAQLTDPSGVTEEDLKGTGETEETAETAEAKETAEQGDQENTETADGSAVQNIQDISGMGISADATAKEGNALLIAGIALVFIAAVAAVLLLKRRGKSSGYSSSSVRTSSGELLQNVPAAQETPDSGETALREGTETAIYMRIDAQEGILIPGGAEFTLNGQLTVGKDPACDIILQNENIPAQVVHIFWDKGMIWMKVLVPDPTVLVNGETEKGMRALRSGDRISIAGFTFRLMF